MDFRIEDRNGLDVPAWDKLARNGSFFHTVSWIDICVDGLSSEARSIFLCGCEGNNLVAGMPAVITRRLGFESFSSMLDGTYGAPIFADKDNMELKNEFLDHLSQYFQNHKFSRVVIADFNGVLSDWHDHRMERTGHFTHVVRLDNVDDFRPHKKIAYDLRAGQKIESEIVDVREESQVEDFYRLYCMTELRHGQKQPRREKVFFNCLLHNLVDSDSLYWRAMIADGVMVGSQIHFIHGDTLFNWQTVSDYEKRQYKPSQLLMHDAIGKAAESGLKQVNLGASPPDAAGLIRYKERWKGERVEYDILTARSGLRKMLGR